MRSGRPVSLRLVQQAGDKPRCAPVGVRCRIPRSVGASDNIGGCAIYRWGQIHESLVQPRGDPRMTTTPTTTTMTVRERGNMWSYRSLIWIFAQRDLKARFKGTALGWLWSLVVPIATLVIYSVVFSTIMRMVPPSFGNGDKGNFTVWLLAGLTAWSMFDNSLNTAIGALLGAGPLLKKIYFPPYAPVLGSVLGLS